MDMSGLYGLQVTVEQLSNAVTTLYEIAEALVYMHSLGVVHGGEYLGTQSNALHAAPSAQQPECFWVDGRSTAQLHDAG
jgi:hypothetical protein